METLAFFSVLDVNGIHFFTILFPHSLETQKAEYNTSAGKVVLATTLFLSSVTKSIRNFGEVLSFPGMLYCMSLANFRLKSNIPDVLISVVTPVVSILGSCSFALLKSVIMTLKLAVVIFFFATMSLQETDPA